MRFKIRYSLRLFLCLAVVSALFIAWLAIHVRDAYERAQISTWVTDVGGTLRYDFEKADSHRPNVFHKSATPTEPEWLRNLGSDNLHQIVMVDLSGKLIVDDDLKALARLTNLENLNLSNTQVTSAGMVHLANLKKLKYLTLWNTRIDDRGLSYLADLNQMYALILDGTDITDAGLVHLRNMTKLEEWLGLAGTKITDDGLYNLYELVDLRNLNLRQTAVTANGVKQMRRTLPKADISFGP